jgi:hypothetical protein
VIESQNLLLIRGEVLIREELLVREELLIREELLKGGPIIAMVNCL